MGEGTRAFVKRPQFFPGFLASLFNAPSDDKQVEEKKGKEEEELTEVEVLGMLVQKEFLGKAAFGEIILHLEGMELKEEDKGSGGSDKDENNNNENLEKVQTGFKKFRFVDKIC